MIDPNAALSPRVWAVAAIVMFAPVMVTFAVAPGIWWANYPGILFHLALFLLVPKLDAPDWAKAAGYAWLAIDVTTGVLTMNGVPHAIADYVRLGGHIFAGIWIVTASLPGTLPVRITGYIGGGWLFLFSFASPFLPLASLGPASIIVLIWLGFIAWQNARPDRTLQGSSPVKARLIVMLMAAGAAAGCHRTTTDAGSDVGANIADAHDNAADAMDN